MSFADAEYAGKRKKTRREVFLEEMEMEMVALWQALLVGLHHERTPAGWRFAEHSPRSSCPDESDAVAVARGARPHARVAEDTIMRFCEASRRAVTSSRPASARKTRTARSDRNRAQRSRVWLPAIIAAIVAAGCGKPTDSELDQQMVLQSVQRIDVPPGEVVMADRTAPVGIVNSTCTVPIMQGIGRYNDVGWAGPMFFIVKSPSNPNGYLLTTLPDGRVRFTARFQSPRSEAEAVQLFRGEHREHEPILFCDVRATLKQLDRAGIKRLAVWPTNAIRASMNMRRVYELDVDLRDWPSSGQVTTSVVLEPDDATVLRQYLRGPVGTTVNFFFDGSWRRTGCTQTIELSGADLSGLRDGEAGSVSLAEIKRAIRLDGVNVAQIRATTQGECGAYSIITPVSAQDTGRSLTCLRRKDALQCRHEGEFMVLPAVYGTSIIIIKAHD